MVQFLCRPFRALHGIGIHPHPGRCPGLCCVGPSGRILDSTLFLVTDRSSFRRTEQPIQYTRPTALKDGPNPSSPRKRGSRNAEAHTFVLHWIPACAGKTGRTVILEPNERPSDTGILLAAPEAIRRRHQVTHGPYSRPFVFIRGSIFELGFPARASARHG